MNKVNYEKFCKDSCKACCYYEECNGRMLKPCMNISQENMDYIASILYKKPTVVIKEENIDD